MTTQFKRKLFIDIETFSEVDLKGCGVYRYAENFELLLFAYAYDEDPVQVVDVANGEQIPQQVIADLTNPEVLKVAHNATFERVCLSHVLNNHRWLDAREWLCTMVRATSMGLPASLKDVGTALGFSEDQAKLRVGASLVRHFCKPCKPTKANGGRLRNTKETDPEKWAQFIEYNRRDVETEITIYKELEAFPPYEHDLYALDQRINDRGILVDTELILSVLSGYEAYKAALIEECREISGINPTQVGALKKWIEQQEGIELSGLTKAVMGELLAGELKPDTRRVLEIRREVGKSSVSKYEAFARCTCRDGRIHGAFQFDGAGRTGRWAGRLIQPQNFPRNEFEDIDLARKLAKAGDFDGLDELYPSLSGVFSTLVRTLVIAPDTFSVADYSAIEARVIAWIAGEKWRLETFAKGEDIYCASASQMFKVPVEKHGQNAHLRKQGKIAELALGYGGGVKALMAFGADKMGLTEEEMQSIVNKWRKASPHIQALWYELGEAAAECIRTGDAQHCRKNIRFRMFNGVLFMRIPSGRELAYYDPRIDEDGELSYQDKGMKSNVWLRAKSWGGKLVENCVQATARDCLASAMMALDEAGYKIVMHVHDEVIAESDDLEGMTAIMSNGLTHSLPWAPDLLLVAEGFKSPYYRKD